MDVEVLLLNDGSQKGLQVSVVFGDCCVKGCGKVHVG